jgi:hypothetical protein
MSGLAGAPRLAAIAGLLALALAAPVADAAAARRAAPRIVPNAVWVAPWGDDANPGTRRQPLASIATGIRQADRTGRRQVYAMPGQHPRFRDTIARPRSVRVSGMPGREPPRIHGAELFGASDLRFSDLVFTGFVYVSSHPTRHWAQRAQRLAFERVLFTNLTPFTGTCLMLRHGAQTIRVRDSRFHECRYGITGPHDGLRDPAQRVRSRDIVVERSWIGPVRTDALQFTHWEDVTIRGNVIDRQHDPLGVDHTDGVQITGDTERVRILGNVFSNGGQLIFVQQPFGWNRDLVIANNLVYGSDNYPVKIAGTRGLWFLGNTVWRSRWSALLLRGEVTGAVVANNALQGYGTTDSPEVVHRDHNFVSGMREQPGPHDIVGGDPGFADPASADFRLVPASRLLGAADPRLALDPPRGFLPGSIGCSLPPQRSVAGQTMTLPSCGAER